VTDDPEHDRSGSPRRFDELSVAPSGVEGRAESRGAGLIALARRGDAVAFSQLFSGFERPIFRYAAHMCGRDAADDIVQETFLALLRPSTALRAGGGGYDPEKGTVGNYLFGIARHFVMKRLSRKEIATFELDEYDLSAGLSAGASAKAGALAKADRQPSVLDSLSRAETIQTVRAAIATLPAPYREVIVLCELQEMSYADAAAVAQCPVGTVRSRLHRAKELLMTKLAATKQLEVGLRRSV
jgi:RNA polymerase sigma-70 factor (ECF subfamily)